MAAAGHTPVTLTITIEDLLAPSPGWLIADQCDWCGNLHDGRCPSPVLEPPAELFDGADDLTLLGQVIRDAVQYLTARSIMDDAPADWALAELAAIARGQPCGPGCFTTPSGLLNPSSVADHFETRRQEAWQRWLPAWACACGCTYKVARDCDGLFFYHPRRTDWQANPPGHHTRPRPRQGQKPPPGLPGRAAGQPCQPARARRGQAEGERLRCLPRMRPPVRRHDRRPPRHPGSPASRQETPARPRSPAGPVLGALPADNGASGTDGVP